MNVRTSVQAQIAGTISQIRRQGAVQAKVQDQLISGVRVKAASDDPAAFASLTQTRAAAGAFGTQLQVISEATTSLDAGVSALLDGNSVMARAKQLATIGADGATDPAAYEGLATEVDSLIERLVQVGNSKFEGQYLFGGEATDSPPFRIDGTNGRGQPIAVTYDGSATSARAIVGSDQNVLTRPVGREVFQNPAGDAFGSLIRLRDTLRDTTLTDSQKTAALNTRLGEVDAARTAIGTAIGVQSSTLSNLEAVQARVTDLRLAANVRTGELEATDFAEAVVRLRESEASYQATLNVASRLIPPSLFEFVR
jgi:flagellar hook-associated protein 3 FlgL